MSKNSRTPMTTTSRALAALTAGLLLAACTPNAGTAPVPTPSASMMPGATPSGMASAMPTAMPSGMASTTPTTGGMPMPPAMSSGTYTQTERLGRPAINEGLILQESDGLLNTWNSVGPKVDLTPAAKPIADEATTVLKALGNSDARIAELFGALLPDVMRIDITRESGYAGTRANPLGNVEPTKGIPIGGRMILDDTIDTTLFLIVPDATDKAVPGLRSDNVGYDTPDANGHRHKPLTTGFPYLAAPN